MLVCLGTARKTAWISNSNSTVKLVAVDKHLAKINLNVYPVVVQSTHSPNFVLVQMISMHLMFQLMVVVQIAFLVLIVLLVATLQKLILGPVLNVPNPM